MSLREDANIIIQESIQAVLPDAAVQRALKDKVFDKGRLYVVATGKAAWQMAKCASVTLGNQITSGIVVTKYDHVKGDIDGMVCFEAGHPVPDSNSYKATQAVLDLVSDLNSEDTVLFLLSGGGSALFEKPLISEEEMANITQQFLACGADITEINTIRKRLSAVKGGKFAKICEPAQVFSIVLSDIIGDPLDMIASGPAYPDSTTAKDAWSIIKKYDIQLSEQAKACIDLETPKSLNNVETMITGSVRNLCEGAKVACEKLGYQSVILSDELTCEAKEAGSFLGSIARYNQNTTQSLAFIIGGETIVHLSGKGKGGRNQEFALASALKIAGLKDTCIFSIGSDGTDGPTDVAGGYVDDMTKTRLDEMNINISDVLQNNDAYHALEKVGGLIITGATGTNVNDVAVLLIKR